MPLKEFALPGEEPTIKVGDVVDVFVERYEDRDGLSAYRANAPAVKRPGRAGKEI